MIVVINEPESADLEALRKTIAALHKKLAEDRIEKLELDPAEKKKIADRLNNP